MSGEKSRRTVVVTGCSSGIGLACAEGLALAGYRVFATVRTEADAEKLRARKIGEAEVFLLDVADEASRTAFCEKVLLALGNEPLAGLVNNAGYALGGPVELIETKYWRHQMEVNLVGPFDLARFFLPRLREARGRIIQISSLSGRVATPFMGAYCASKFAMEAASDALRLELRGTGVEVVLVEPGRIRTSIFDKAARQLQEQQAAADPVRLAPYARMFRGAENMVEAARHGGVKPEAVAEVVRHALESSSPRHRYLVGADAVFTVLAGRWLPTRWFDAVATWVFEQAIRGRPL
jgi:NAD(P)-dependent dehydrogenase (short-subunit alcohol dehydrogenase family)